MDFITCPGCQNAVPIGLANCQFCGTSLAAINKTIPKAKWNDTYDPHKVSYSGGRPGWVWPLYYGICGWFILSGLMDIPQGLGMFAKKPDEAGINLFVLIFAGIDILLGIGLLFKVEFIRGIVNFVCGIGLILGAIDIFSASHRLHFGVHSV